LFRLRQAARGGSRASPYTAAHVALFIVQIQLDNFIAGSGPGVFTSTDTMNVSPDTLRPVRWKDRCYANVV